MPKTYRKPCPHCDRGPKDRALAITANRRGIMWYCHRCHWSGSHKWEYLMRVAMERERIEVELRVSIDVSTGSVRARASGP